MTFCNNDNDFDAELYKKLNLDLANFSYHELIHHYKNYGKKEGRFCSEIFLISKKVHHISF